MNFLQRTPFFRFLLFLAAGIVLFQFVRLPAVAIAGIASVAGIGLITDFFLIKKDIHYRFRWIFGFATFLILLAAGYTSSLIFEKQHVFNELNDRKIYEVELRSAPVEKERSFMSKVRLIRKYESGKEKHCSGNAIIYLQKDSAASELIIGDRLLIEAEFQRPDGVQNPGGFDYANYLKRQGINATAYIPAEKWRKNGENIHFNLLRLADRSRNLLLNIYRKFGINGDEFAVLAALTLGYTDALQPDLLKSYSATGATHILSVSGLHVGIVYAVIFFLLGFLSKTRSGRIIRAVIVSLFIWMYAFLTGLSPAVMRAALMITFVAAGTCSDKKSQTVNTVLISAFLLLLLNPNLLFNIGFQLSYSAVLSIVFFQPKISKLLFVKNSFLKKVWDLTAVSIAAQIGTAPFALYYFQQFPNYFLLTNYVAIPISTVIIYLAMALLFLSKVPLLSSAIAYALKWTTWFMNFLIEKIQDIPGSICIIPLNVIQLILCFVVIFSFSAYFINRKFAPLMAGLASILLILGIYNYQKYSSLTSSKLIVFSDNRVPVINFTDGTDNYVYTTDSVQAVKTASSYWKSNLLSKPTYLNDNEWFKDGFVSFGNMRILILKDDFLKFKVAPKPLDVDYLIISNKLKPKMEQILNCIHPEHVIVDKSITAWYANHIREVCLARQINYYSVAEKGAFISHLER